MDPEMLFKKLCNVLHREGMPDAITDENVALGALKFANEYLGGVAEYITDDDHGPRNTQWTLGETVDQQVQQLRSTLLEKGMPVTIGPVQIAAAVFVFALENLDKMVDYIEDSAVPRLNAQEDAPIRPQTEKEPAPEKEKEEEEDDLPPTTYDDLQDQLDTDFGFKTEQPKGTPGNMHKRKKENKPKDVPLQSEEDEYFGARVIH